MIACQQSIMLDTALAFEKLVKNPNSGSKNKGSNTQVTWDNPKEVEQYITKLQIVAEKLTTDNRKLRKCHNVMIDKVGKPLLVTNQKKRPFQKMVCPFIWSANP